MLRTYWLKLKNTHFRALGEQKGQSLIIFVFAILGLIAMMGLALDLGLVYIERVRISRTTDAATLASVVELPFEEEAIRRAAEFIELNGYTQEDTEIRVRGCIVELDSDTLGNVGEGLGNPPSRAPYPDDDPVNASPANLTDGYVYQPALSNPPRSIFVIDTLAFQPVDRDGTGAVTTPNSANCDDAGGSPLYGTANKLRVSGQSLVDMNFMQFFGFGEVPVSDQAVGENVTNLDVVVVFDVSGSMQFESNCFGCWNENAISSTNIMANPYPLNGDFNPLGYRPPKAGGGPYNIYWGGTTNPANTTIAGDPVCSSNPTPVDIPPYSYSIHEAEFYSQDSPLHGWEFSQRQAGHGFWVLQRTNRGSNGSYMRPHPFPTYGQSAINENPRLQGGAYDGQCFDANGQCWRVEGLALTPPETAPNNPPFLEYDFTVNWAGGANPNSHIWIRAMGGTNFSFEWAGIDAESITLFQNNIYWQVDGGTVGGGPFANLNNMGGSWQTPNNDNWRWVKIGHNLNLSNGSHVLRMYQGSSGFALDKIIITNNPAGVVGTTLQKNGTTTPGNSTIGMTDIVKDNDGGGPDNGWGPDATPGSATREACNMCNPAFGRTVSGPECSCKTGSGDNTVNIYLGGGTGIGCTRVTTNTNQLENDLFHGIDPLRSAQEAVKNFAARLDPKFDQIGVVAYSNNIKARVKLQCLKDAQQNEIAGAAKCFDPNIGGGPITYTVVIQDVEDREPNGSTNLAMGMREGLEELGIEVAGYNTGITSDCTRPVEQEGDGVDGDKHPCDRRGAARRVLVLMTDGAPNNNVSCPGAYNWRGLLGGGDNDYDCAVYYAQQAANNNVIVYTIGIGSGVNRALLTAMAEGQISDPTMLAESHASGDNGYYFEGKGGKYFPAAQPDDLDAIFEQILNNIFVRIVG